MKTIARYYNCICTPKYQALGFSRSRSTFARIIGDVLHVFSFKSSCDASTCSVEFGIFPLCLPQPIFLDAGGYALEEFIVDPPVESTGWTFDPHAEESVINCIYSISEAIDLYLLPFFEICSNCETALPELVKLEELFDQNRQIRLRQRGDFDSAVPWQERSLFDSRKYYMAIKAHNLPYAQQYLNHQINFCKTKLESFDKPDAPRQPDAVRQRFSRKLSSSLEHLQRLNAEDFCYFDDLLKSNECKMLEFLAGKYPRISSKRQGE